MITKSYTIGIGFGYSGTYLWFELWCSNRVIAFEYGLGEVRLYFTKWWKTYYDNKGKVSWQGVIVERKGGFKCTLNVLKLIKIKY